MTKPTYSVSDCVASARKHLVHGTSDKARNENIATEIAAKKPVKQAVAIGYAVQRDAKAKKGKK